MDVLAYSLYWRILGVVLFLGIKANAQCMVLTAHSQSMGGRFMPTIHSMGDCAERCLSDLRCHGVDFNKLQKSCWMHEQWRPIIRARCPCHHLEKIFQCKLSVPECFSIVNNKTTYYGTKRTTAAGLSCQRWDQQSPHKHNVNNSANFPDETVSAAENFCRDPDGEGYPWCYTTNPRIRWGSCGVTSCTGPFTMKLGIGHQNQRTTIQSTDQTTRTNTMVDTVDEVMKNQSSELLTSHYNSDVLAISPCNNSRVIYPETSTIVVGCVAAASLIVSMVLIAIRVTCNKNIQEYSPNPKTNSEENTENVKMSRFNVYKRF